MMQYSCAVCIVKVSQWCTNGVMVVLGWCIVVSRWCWGGVQWCYDSSLLLCLIWGFPVDLFLNPKPLKLPTLTSDSLAASSGGGKESTVRSSKLSFSSSSLSPPSSSSLSPSSPESLSPSPSSSSSASGCRGLLYHRNNVAGHNTNNAHNETSTTCVAHY